MEDRRVVWFISEVQLLLQVIKDSAILQALDGKSLNMEVLKNVTNDLQSSGEESETDEREQRFKENYEAALSEGCEKSSGSSNESLRRDCPELYNDYRAQVMQHLECLEGGTTQVQLDTHRDGRAPFVIRELGADEETRIGVEWCDGDDHATVRDETSARVRDEEINGNASSNSTDESNGRLSSNSTDEFNRLVSSNGTEESTERTSSSSTGESNAPTSSNSTSSVDEEAPEYLPDNTLPMYVKVSERSCDKNIASVFEEMSPNVALSNDTETGGQMRGDAPLIHEGTDAYAPGDIPANCGETVMWHLPGYALSGKEVTDGRLSSSPNGDADYVLTGNEEMVGHLSSSLNNAERHKPMPDCALMGGEVMVGHLASSLNNAEINKPMPDCALTGDEAMVGYLSNSLNNSEIHKPMPDCALTENKETVGCFSSSLNNADIYMSMPDCSLTENKEMSRSIDLDGHRASLRDYTSMNGELGGLVPDRNASLGLNELDYTSIGNQTGERVPNRILSGPNQDVYGRTALDYTSSDKAVGDMPYRSALTMDERLAARRRDELRRAPLLKKEEFGRPAEWGVFTADCSKDARTPQPPGSRSAEDLGSQGPPSVRPPPPKVSFFSFEQELSRCENALREAKAELREERKKQVVVDTFRMNLLEVDRMCSEEMSRLRQDAARLEPLNQMAAEWGRDTRQAFWYDRYNREQQRPVGRDCFVKSYVRRLGDPETCQAGEVRPPTV